MDVGRLAGCHAVQLDRHGEQRDQLAELHVNHHGVRPVGTHTLKIDVLTFRRLSQQPLSPDLTHGPGLQRQGATTSL